MVHIQMSFTSKTTVLGVYNQVWELEFVSNQRYLAVADYNLSDEIDGDDINQLEDLKIFRRQRKIKPLVPYQRV